MQQGLCGGRKLARQTTAAKAGGMKGTKKKGKVFIAKFKFWKSVGS
jgi:hypothetical protein